MTMMPAARSFQLERSPRFNEHRFVNSSALEWLGLIGGLLLELRRPDVLRMIFGFLGTFLETAAPFLFEPSKRKASALAEDLLRRGFPAPRRGDCGNGKQAGHGPARAAFYLRRIVRTEPRLREGAAAELARIEGAGNASWRRLRLFQAALAEMGFVETDPVMVRFYGQ